MSKRFALLLLVLVALASPAAAQVTGPPFVFTAGTVISPDEMNTNFSTIYDDALNRFAPVAAANFTFSPTNTFDLSGMRDLAVGRNETVGGTLGVTSGATVGGQLVVSSTAAAAILVGGGITAGSGNVAIVGTDGRVPAISSTYFASLSGANLTSIPETAITDGTLLARVGGNETISGTWTFSTNPTFNANAIPETAIADGSLLARVAANETVSANGGWTFSGTSPQLTFSNGTSNWIAWPTTGAGAPTLITRSAGTRLLLYPNVDASHTDFAFGIESGALWTSIADSTGSFKWYGGTTQVGSLTGTGNWSIFGAPAFSATISPSALANGNNNDYNPSGLSTAFALRLSANGGGSTLTGLAAQPSGSIRVVCDIAGGNLSFTNNDAASTAANRFTLNGTVTIAAGECITIWYDGSGTRWVRIG